MGLLDKVFKKSEQNESLPAQRPSETDIVASMMNIQYVPVMVDSETDLQEYQKFSFAELASLGTAFATIATPLRTASQKFNIPVEGIYRAHGLGKTGRLAMSKEGYNLGTIMAEKGTGRRGFVGQTRWEKLDGLSGSRSLQLPYDPTLLILAVALHEMNQRFDEIKEIGFEILEFLEQDKESQLRSSLVYLQDVLKNYKHNCNSDKYKTNQHIKVLDIKKDALDKLEFYRERIERRNAKQLGFLYSAHSVNEKSKALVKEFKNFRFSLYVYSFASFLEVMLLENFDSEYLSSITEDIEQRATKYDALYSTCFEQLDGQAKSAVENQIIGSVGSAIRFMGKTIEKIPAISDSQVDESLIAAGDNLLKNREKKSRKMAERLESVQDSVVLPFVENLHIVDRLYNQSVDVLFDQDYLYVKSLTT